MMITLSSIEFSRLDFFPNGTILDAKEAPSASYAWKSILKGREVIKKGSLWMVGDRKQIRIWGDNCSNNYKV